MSEGLNNKEIPLYKDIYELIRTTDEAIKNIPGNYRDYSKNIRDIGIRLLSIICVANNSIDHSKKSELISEAFSLTWNYILLVRLLTDFKCIDLGHNAELILSLDSIKNQLVGWFNSINKK